MSGASGKCAQRCWEAGFTLVELLVAFTLFSLLSLLSLLVVAALRFGIQAWERGGYHAARQAQRLRRRENDDGAPGSPYSPLRDRGDRQRKLALQKPDLRLSSVARRSPPGVHSASPRAPLRRS